jgi:hypothetical protein
MSAESNAPAKPPIGVPVADIPGVTTERIWKILEKSNFAVVSHVTPNGEPRSSGVGFGTRNHRLFMVVGPNSSKARCIREGCVVALTVPVRRGGLLSLLLPLPPAVINFHARAHPGEPCVLDKSKLPPSLARALPDSDEEVCILEVEPVGNFLTYGIGVSLMTMRHPDLAHARVPVA